MDGWIDGWMDGWMDGWVDGWMDRWMDGEMERRKYVTRSDKRDLVAREVISRYEPKISVGVNLGEIEIFAPVHSTGIILPYLRFLLHKTVCKYA